MSDTTPPVLTLLRSPERAAVGVLQAAADIARNALLAAHPQLACDPTGDPLDRAVRVSLKHLGQRRRRLLDRPPVVPDVRVGYDGALAVDDSHLDTDAADVKSH